MNNVACPFCSHPYVDRPNTNSPNVAHNEKVTNKYLEDKAEFDREKAAGTLEEGRKALRKPTYENKGLKAVYLQCHCSQMTSTKTRSLALPSVQ